MNRNTKIKEVMTAFPHSIGLTQTLEVAKEMMRTHGIKHLPVQDGGQLVGLLSHRDIHFVIGLEKKDAKSLLVSDAFSEDLYVVTPETRLVEVAGRMAEERLGCTLIAENGSLKGILTATDACRLLAEALN